MLSLAKLIDEAINIYTWVVIASAIMSWLVAFNVINGTNPYVRQIGFALRRLTEPLLGPIRRMLPDLGAIDISPVILLIGLQVVRYFVAYYGMRLLM